MPAKYVAYFLLSGLALALLYAAFTDLRRRRIDNRLTAAIALAAPLFWWAGGLGWDAIGVQLALAAASFVLLALLFALKVMGGGDVKLLSALALWLRPAAFADLLVVMALLGGVLTAGCAAWHIARRRRDLIAIPYGVAIAGAGVWVLTSAYLPAR